VEEMLLRLRWDDSDDMARRKLTKIIARIWDDLEGVDLTGQPPLSSALWLDDDDDAEVAAETQCTATVAPAIELASMAASGAASADQELESAPTSEVEAHAPADAPAEEPSEAADVVHGNPTPQVPETRIARDGGAYTRQEFLEHYGDVRGADMWEEAGATDDSAAAPCANTWEGRAAAAQAKMDAGLEAALANVPEEDRRRMERFAADQRANSRMKLPLALSAKERKAIHLWADMNRVQHRSFGYRGRRRLWLFVGDAPAGGESAHREDGEEGSWQEDDEYSDEDWD